MLQRKCAYYSCKNASSTLAYFWVAVGIVSQQSGACIFVRGFGRALFLLSKGGIQMSNEGIARFTRLPQRIQDLDRKNSETTEHSYRIIIRLRLETLEFVRFTTNMSARRWDIEAYEKLCFSGNPFNCILVYPAGFEVEGILVVPDEDTGVAYAAHVYM